jgi:hypothetical protein
LSHIEAIPLKESKSPDAIVWFLQGLLASAYGTEIKEIKIDYLTDNGWIRTQIK